MVATLVLVGGLIPAMAEDCTAPCVGSKITVGLNGDSIFSASPNTLKANSLLPEIGVESYLLPFENFKLVSVVNLEQVVEPALGRNPVFSGLGLFQSELYAEYTFEPLTLTAGTIDPVFSLASEAGDGVFAADLADNADMNESLGMAATVDFNLAGYSHSLTGTAFSMDRSFLAKSWIKHRPVPKLSDGGAGNSTGISSLSLVLDGCFGAEAGDCQEDGQFGYRLGARYQRYGVQTTDQVDEDIIPRNELALLGALQSNFDLGEHELRLMTEAAYIKNFESNPVDALILTGIAAYVTDAFTYSAALSRQSITGAGLPRSERLAELAIAYDPETGLGLPSSDWSITGAYAYGVNEEKQKRHVLSLRLKLELGTSYSLR